MSYAPDRIANRPKTPVPTYSSPTTAEKLPDELCRSRGTFSSVVIHEGAPLMTTLCKPSVNVPEHIITMDETLELAAQTHREHPQLSLVLRLIRNTGVTKRHLVQPIEKTLRHPGLEERNRLHDAEAKKRTPQVILNALSNAELSVRDIDAIIYVSCTSFTMPSPTAWLINELGFRSDTRQIPIAQLGCAAGGAAINRAHDFCTAYPDKNVLIVSCELCSLCYQPTDTSVGSLLSVGLFGDAVAAAVVRGAGGTGISLERNASYLIPNTEEWISYAVRATGFHFQLDRRVPGTMEPLAPEIRKLAMSHGWDAGALDFYIVHAGGPRILDDLSKFLDVPSDVFRYSRATLTQYGNIASAVVLDALARLFDDGGAVVNGQGLIAGFGPGITAEMALGTWVQAKEKPQISHFSRGADQRILTADRS
jgi:1,3,6,8-tetrahydroxynaphthalene synthase